MNTILTKNQSPEPQLRSKIKDLKSKTKVHFYKLHGAGNDFVVLNALESPLPENFDFARAAQEMCAPHFGVGGDGLLLLEAPTIPGADVRKRMWNPDGTEDMCGNGLRCLARLAHDKGHVSQSEFTVQTLAGLRTCQALENGQFRIEMGAPNWEFSAIPMQSVPRSSTMEYALSVGGRTFENVVSLSTGSTHTVIFLDEELSEEEFQILSPQIENHALFPERTTIMWARVLDKNNIRVRIWERGAGETLACGTGASAVAVAAKTTGRAEGIIAVQSKGGTLQIEWENAPQNDTPPGAATPNGEPPSNPDDKKGRPIFMTGPTAFVFSGYLEL